MEPLTLGFGATLLTGLLFGAGPCNITCLPYLGPIFLAQEGGLRRSLAIVLPFSLGRLAGYAMLGAAAGYAGKTATEWLEQGPASWLLGAAAVGLGLMLFRRAGRQVGCAVVKDVPAEQRVTLDTRARRDRPMPLGLFAMGAGMALNPCLPLATVLAVAAASAQPLQGLGLGLAFGLGAVVIPTLLFGVVVAHFGEQVRHHLGHWRSTLERAAGGMLVMMGMMTLLGWVQP